MLEMSLKFLTNIVKFIYVYIALHMIIKEKVNWKQMFVTTIVYNVGCMFIKDNDYRMYTLQCVFTVGYFYFLGKHKQVKTNILIPWICMMLLSYEIINMLTNFIGVIIVSFLPVFPGSVQSILVIISTIFKCILIYYILMGIDINCKKLINVIKKSYLVCFVYFLAVCFKISILYTVVIN